MATFITLASFAWSIAVGIFKSIDWSSKWTIAVLTFVGGCQFDRSFLWHPKAAPSVVSPDNPSPRKPILPWRASEAGAGEIQPSRKPAQPFEPTPDPISENTPGAPDQPADETRPKMADLLDDVNADLNARMNFEPNPKPVKANSPATSCGPRGCPPSAGGGGGGFFRRGIFRRR
jgi:hypothetical protein